MSKEFHLDDEKSKCEEARASSEVQSQIYQIPPCQQPYEKGISLGFDDLASRVLSIERLSALGVELDGDAIRIPVLDRYLLVNPVKHEITVDSGLPVKAMWALLALHYLASDGMSYDAREVSFNHFADCRTYFSVYSKRILGRFLATIGRSGQQFEQASESLNGKRISGTGIRYSFNVMPRVPISIVRYEGDEEFGPSANVIYRADAASLLPAEDRIVAVELLLDALAGKPMEGP